jgi:hypothetical protein
VAEIAAETVLPVPRPVTQHLKTLCEDLSFIVEGNQTRVGVAPLPLPREAFTCCVGAPRQFGWVSGQRIAQASSATAPAGDRSGSKLGGGGPGHAGNG